MIVIWLNILSRDCSLICQKLDNQLFNEKKLFSAHNLWLSIMNLEARKIKMNKKNIDSWEKVYYIIMYGQREGCKWNESE